ncbi:MAG: hypothetical protein SPE49_06125 [Campylobacter sp.]|uniref:hypothetical protein n=1 Tax=Campylobacter sp. TaxID=205 RepID=UPI002A81E421|nr:hypothetical protein [Campylobacter sp.]MCI7587218.1 hypothetical protein [Campylobacter sp.]MDY5115527.1 hypothetical protein [Campylobacter sp.]
MQKPKSLEQIANELAAKREPIKMEPKPKNTGGIDLSRAAGAIKEQPKQQPKQNLAQKSRIPSATGRQPQSTQKSRIPNQNLAQKAGLNSEQNASNSRIPSASQIQSTQKSRIPNQNKAQSNSRIPNQNLAQKAGLNSEQNARNSRIPSASQPQSTQKSRIPNQNKAQSNSRIPNQNLAQKPESKPESKIEPKPEQKDEKIVIKPKITTFRDDISALYETPAQNLSKTSLFIAFGIAFLVMIATLPKIFIANEIYYTSRDIGTLRDKLGVLNEENRELKSKLEQIRYQNQIIDNLR